MLPNLLPETAHKPHAPLLAKDQYQTLAEQKNASAMLKKRLPKLQSNQFRAHKQAWRRCEIAHISGFYLETVTALVAEAVDDQSEKNETKAA